MLNRTGMAVSVVCFALTSAAHAQSGTLDQSSPADNASFNLSSSSLTWQQQVRTSMSGQLEGVTLYMTGDTGAQVFVEIRIGDAWVYDSPVYSSSYTKTFSGQEEFFFDMTDEGIFLNAGDTFVIHTYGNDTGMNLRGSYRQPPENPLYPEPLYLNENLFADNGWRHAFDTYMLEGGALSLSVSGSCPGQLTADVSGATPGGNVAFIFGTGTGSVVIPNGPCAGTELGLNASARLVGTDRADANGNASLTGNAPAAACGGFLQALDVDTCTTSSVEQF